MLIRSVTDSQGVAQDSYSCAEKMMMFVALWCGTALCKRVFGRTGGGGGYLEGQV